MCHRFLDLFVMDSPQAARLQPLLQNGELLMELHCASDTQIMKYQSEHVRHTAVETGVAEDFARHTTRIEDDRTYALNWRTVGLKTGNAQIMSLVDPNQCPDYCDQQCHVASGVGHRRRSLHGKFSPVTWDRGCCCILAFSVDGR